MLLYLTAAIAQVNYELAGELGKELDNSLIMAIVGCSFNLKTTLRMRLAWPGAGEP